MNKTVNETSTIIPVFLGSWYMIVIYVNAVLGIIIFEKAYYGTRVHRDENLKKLHANFPHLRRLDVDRWARWKFWPGAATILIPRVLLTLVIFLWFYLGLIVLLCGHASDKPMTGCRRWLIKMHYKFWGGFVGYIILFLHVSTIFEKDVSYRPWLGPE